MKVLSKLPAQNPSDCQKNAKREKCNKICRPKLCNSTGIPWRLCGYNGNQLRLPVDFGGFPLVSPAGSQTFLCKTLRLFCNKRSVLFHRQNEDPLAYIPGAEWVLVTDPIVAFRSEASFDGSVTGHARRGDIFCVQGRALVSSKDGNGGKVVTQWYQLEQGWLDQDTVSVYGNRMQAESASGKILEK